VARLTLPRRRLVEAHRPPRHVLHQLVAVVATHVNMRSLDRKRRAMRVIEDRRLPLRHIVAAVARRHLLRFGKLPAMHFFMAVFTLGRRNTEIDMNQLGFHRWRLVTLPTLHRPVRSQKGKFRLRMVELRQILPSLGVVASLTAQRLPVGSQLVHSFLKLPVVNVLVATRANQRLPLENHRRLGRRLVTELIQGRRVGTDKTGRQRFVFLVAILAGSRHMPAGQREPGVFMF